MAIGDLLRAIDRRPATRPIMLTVGTLIIVASPIVGVLPGPGGIFVFAGGLSIVLRYSVWAKRRYVHFKRRWPRHGAWADWGLRRRSAKRRADRLAIPPERD